MILEALDIETPLRSQGFSSLGTLLNPAECRSIAALYEDSPESFRSRIQMERFRFGRGEYQYFGYPLPKMVADLRTNLYAQLSPIATRWMQDLRQEIVYPPKLEEFLETCHAAGQTRPTPLLLRYREGDYNCLHQDVYGDIVFPFQVIIALSRQDVDFEGGELLLVEQQPRAQSVPRVIPIRQGEAVAITTRYRPAKGTRGFYRTNVRHGVSLVRSGERFTLGIIFHDAR